MSLLFESIRIINGQSRNLKYHQNRIDKAFLFHNKITKLDLKSIIKRLSLPKKGLHKLRISYCLNEKLIQTKITPYFEKEIKSLKLIELKEEVYNHKFEDRDFINSSYKKKGKADDILFYKNNKVLDTSYCNIAFYNGEKWLTPKIPLLAGTMREKLIEKGIIIEGDIKIDEIKNFQKARLFNAMILWSNKKEVDKFSI